MLTPAQQLLCRAARQLTAAAAAPTPLLLRRPARPLLRLHAGPAGHCRAWLPFATAAPAGNTVSPSHTTHTIRLCQRLRVLNSTEQLHAVNMHSQECLTACKLLSQTTG